MNCGNCAEGAVEPLEVLSKISGIYKYSYEVTPTGRHALAYDEESWKPNSEDKPKETDLTRNSDIRQSKTKRVKNYLKKCKHALGSRSNSSEQSSNGEPPERSSWYLDKQLEAIINEGEVNELEDVFEDAQSSIDLDVRDGLPQVASVIEVKSNRDSNESEEIDDVVKAVPLDEETFSPPLVPVQETVDESGKIPVDVETAEEVNDSIKSEVESLVDKYFGSLYKNYERSRKCLIRQARDLLVCEYHGCLYNFENDFCIQASKLLQRIKDDQTDSTTLSTGWPLCHGKSGVVAHLGPLDPSVVRNRDCYICVRTRSAPGLEVTLFWRNRHEIHWRTIAEFRDPVHNLDDIMCSSLRSPSDLELSSYDDYDGAELPELLQNLLVSVEHAIKRVPLDDLAFPCPHCHQYLPLERADDEVSKCVCQCSCRLPDSPVMKTTTSIQTSPMFEFANSIPHIDSDEEEDKESIRSGSSNKRLEIARPKRITELPDKLLMSGINLPGTVDNEGRPVILCYAECITRAGLNKYEIAKLLLYYSTIPTVESTEKGFIILLLAENEADHKIIEILDKSVSLISASLTVRRYLVWRPGINKEHEKHLPSKTEIIFIPDENALETFLPIEQAPASCGGPCTHDQLEWVEFFKQLEPFIADCKTAGRSLLSTLSQLRNEEMPHQITRKFLSHQCRQISKALESENVQILKREGKKTLNSITERSQWLANSRDVKRAVSFAFDSHNSVERVTRRLEQLKQERIERMKELARFRTLQSEADELYNWISQTGEETLTDLISRLRSTVNAAGAKAVANDFEKFFYFAWRQHEKCEDLIKEFKSIKVPKGQNLSENSQNLETQMTSFKEKLEDTRERIEDTSRCFLLLESCHDILEDDNKEQEEFIKIAMKSKNEKLLQICKSVQKNEEADPNQPPDKCSKAPPYSKDELSATSTPIKSQNTSIRRRSVSSVAFIYHCNHHAAGEVCNCYESDAENSVSYHLKKKYIALQNCGCDVNSGKDTLERKNSGALDGIKEERESIENLFEKIETDHNDCRRCDSGLSTADNSVGEESVYNKKKLQRTCSCQHYRESCTLCSTGSSSVGSNQDQMDNQQDSIIEEGSDGFIKSNSSDDIEDDNYSEERRKVPPISANSHLHCHNSTFDLPSDALYNNMDPKTQKTLKFIIKEMIETERDYVKSLDYIIVNYIPELQREDIPQALRGQRNTVFGNVEKIYEFHSQYFLHELEQCENNPLLVGDIFLRHKKRFYLYALYNKNKPKSDSLMSEYGSLFFKSKQIELGDKMDLASYLLKPVQRMGKYALLLQQMMKACPDSSVSYGERSILGLDDLKSAEEMVRFQLRHGNDLLAMDSIRECDVNLKEQGRLLRQNEFLVWEGRSGKKSLRQVFLFEDLILFSKARRFPDRKNLDLYIYKNSIKMTDIGLTAKIGDSPTKFEIWFRKRKPNDTYTLQSMSEDIKKLWTEELSQLLWTQAIKNRAIRMAEMSSMGIGNKPCLDIKPSEDQISDRSISFAQLNKTCTHFPAAPKFRNTIAGPVVDLCRNTSKRPHSVISMSSVSSGSTSSAGSAGTPTGPLNSSLSFESGCESPKAYHRSATLNSQCSMESGIIADMSVGSDECSEQAQTGL
ncbi:uncharacterized protein LOC109601686 isoform X4 [Aethina tumida]|uniref:uncharacterized protein LOC109601686 isoform X4 n=1 Tax=Aethina tumida TaxID=116153 RepID=UPI002148FB2F|nr:uncharacterized protein LOC109601686 isoform X4 [Aethina tumida]